MDAAETRTFDCHTSNGNPECPASEVQFVVVGKIKLLARKLLRARQEHNTEKEVEVLTFVGKQGVAFKTRFYDVLESLCEPNQQKHKQGAKRPSSDSSS
jgi:hypothetical protein